MTLPSLFTNAPQQGPFEGRRTDLDAINTFAGIANRIVCISGQPGIGKTALLREFFFLAGNKVNVMGQPHFQHTLWLEGDLDVNATTLMNTLQVNSMPEVIEALAHLEGNKLLCMDNAPDDISRLAYLSRHNWTIFITSPGRIRETIPYELQELNIDDAIRIFCLYYGQDPDQLKTYEMEVVSDIVCRLLQHTLALEIAGRNAGQLGWSLQEVNQAMKAQDLNIPRLADMSLQLTPSRVKFLFDKLAALFPDDVYSKLKMALPVK